MNRRKFLAGASTACTIGLSGCLYNNASDVTIQGESQYVRSLELVQDDLMVKTLEVNWKSVVDFPSGSLPTYLAIENVDSGEMGSLHHLDWSTNRQSDYYPPGWLNTFDPGTTYRLYVFREQVDSPDSTWADDGGITPIDSFTFTVE